MSEQIRLKPCPFCGSTEIQASETGSGQDADVTVGWVKCCYCGTTLSAIAIKAKYVQIESDLYRLVSGKSGLDAAIEKWNTRANSDDLSPIEKGE